MFDSKQCQRCGATAKAGWDFGGGSRQPAASSRSCEAQADPERSRSIVGSAAATKRASPRMQTNNPTRYTRVSTPSYRIGTFLHVEHCESVAQNWHGMGKDMCMAQLYLYSSRQSKLASIFIANMEMMGMLVAEHRLYTWRHRLHFRLERLSTDNERRANKLEILHESNTIFL